MKFYNLILLIFIFTTFNFLIQSSSDPKKTCPFEEIEKTNVPAIILNVGFGENYKSIEKKYKDLLRRCHPDKNLGNKERAEAAVEKIQKAFNYYTELEEGKKKKPPKQELQEMLNASIGRLNIGIEDLRNAFSLYDGGKQKEGLKSFELLTTSQILANEITDAEFNLQNNKKYKSISESDKENLNFKIDEAKNLNNTYLELFVTASVISINYKLNNEIKIIRENIQSAQDKNQPIDILKNILYQLTQLTKKQIITNEINSLYPLIPLAYKSKLEPLVNDAKKLNVKYNDLFELAKEEKAILEKNIKKELLKQYLFNLSSELNNLNETFNSF